MSAWIKTADQLPPEGKYVLARHNRGTWHDSSDQENVNCVVVKLVRGLSALDREKMKSGEIPDPPYSSSTRSRFYCSQDEFGNNRVPYHFTQFGPDNFFGQTITHWMSIPSIGGAETSQAARPAAPAEPSQTPTGTTQDG